MSGRPTDEDLWDRAHADYLRSKAPNAASWYQLAPHIRMNFKEGATKKHGRSQMPILSQADIEAVTASEMEEEQRQTLARRQSNEAKHTAAELLREKRAAEGRELHEANALLFVDSTAPDDARDLEALRKKLYGEPADGTLWEDEGMVHRAALTAHGDYGVAVLWVAQIKNMDGQTIYLTPEKRRSLAAALLEGLSEED